MSVRRAILWSALGQVGYFVVQFGSQVLLTRLLTPTEVGVYVASVAFVAVMSAFQSFGLGQLLIREAELARTTIRTAFAVNLVAAIILTICAASASGSIGALFGSPAMGPIIALLAVTPTLSAFELVPSAMLQREMRFGVIAAIGMIRAGTTGLVSVLLALRGFGPLSMGIGALSGAAASMIVTNLFGWRHIELRPSFANWRYVLGFARDMFAIGGLAVLSGRLADLVLGKVAGVAALGIYSRASAINNLAWENLHVVFARVLLPELAARKRSEGGLRAPYMYIVEMALPLLWAAFGGLALLAGPVIHALYGPRWSAAALPLTALCAASMVAAMVSMAWEIFVVCGRTREQTRIEIVRTLFGLTVFALGCTVSASVAAATRIADSAVAVLLYRPKLREMTDTRFKDLLGSYGRALLAAGAAVSPTVLLMTLHQWSAAVSLPLVGLAVVTGALAWLGALRWMNHELSKEIFALIRKVAVRLERRP